MIENRTIQRKSENKSLKESLNATHPETHTLSDPSGRYLTDRAGWRNPQKRGNNISAAELSQWSTQYAATGLVLSCPTKNVLEHLSCFRRGQEAVIISFRLRRSFSLVLEPVFYEGKKQFFIQGEADRCIGGVIA